MSAARAPSLLEMDPAPGRRGRRSGLAEEHLVALTGAEAALVANNNAAALAVVVYAEEKARGRVARNRPLLDRWSNRLFLKPEDR